MNLNAYDNVIEKIDKTRTWVDVSKKLLFSREIKYRPYVCLLKRYIPRTNTTSYYIALLDNPPVDRKYRHTIVDDYGRVKIKISDIWNETGLAQLVDNCNIMCDFVESDKDGEIYFLDI